MEAVDLELPPDPQGDNIADGYPTKMIGVCVASIWLLAAAATPEGGYITVGTEEVALELTGLKTYMIIVGSTGLVRAAPTGPRRTAPISLTPPARRHKSKKLCTPVVALSRRPLLTHATCPARRSLGP